MSSCAPTAESLRRKLKCGREQLCNPGGLPTITTCSSRTPPFSRPRFVCPPFTPDFQSVSNSEKPRAVVRPRSASG
ncbi:hypothetical protein AV530_000661 [Patagioenas fasciata monilis]|uniref:Uncharacterized protein n=1 Tax=Patagioenas fasciata monilis TaxID=372326 RepID=A0A1V4IG15_PATFA|nr:hypothetical protein AV530_000661 [Patagioenas fasciata monilis]